MQFDARSLSVHTKATNSNSKPHKHTQNGNNEPDNMNVEKIWGWFFLLWNGTYWRNGLTYVKEYI